MKTSSKTKRVLPLFFAAVASCVAFVQCELYTPVFNNPLDPKGTQNTAGSGAGSTSVQSTVAASMVTIPGGTFQMGQVGIAEPVHTVTLSSFRIGKYEITQSQYQTIMGNNPSGFKANPDAATSPVEQVTWFDAVEFCNKLSQADGLQPVFTITSRAPATGYPITAATVTADWEKNGYRLPTEAQWEYAARGGTTSTYYWGEAMDSATVGQYAWFRDNSGNRTHGVGQKTPNSYGLYDMSSNVWEWSWDWYGTYSGTAHTDPTGPASGPDRVNRGGSWYDGASGCPVSSRANSGPYNRGYTVGFRVVAPGASAAVPTFSLAGGQYTGSQTVSITTATVGASIRYTIDGSTPSAAVGTLYSGPVAIAATTTIKAIAYKTGIAGSESPVVSQTYTILTPQPTTVAASLVNIPGGTFQMGQVGIAEPVHNVTLSPFRMSKYEITQSQYEVVMGYNPSDFKTNPDAATSPVEHVTWYDAVEFCNKLSQADGLQPVYTIIGRIPATGYPINAATVTVDWGKSGYRLPTEAQWEYAARAGTGSTYYWGEASDDTTVVQYAWFFSNASNRTHGVGQKTPNVYGLYDMSGNVWEWNWDWYGTYGSGAQTDPTGSGTGSNRVRRGGSWYNYASDCTVSNRHDYVLDIRYYALGFRVVAP